MPKKTQGKTWNIEINKIIFVFSLLDMLDQGASGSNRVSDFLPLIGKNPDFNWAKVALMNNLKYLKSKAAQKALWEEIVRFGGVEFAKKVFRMLTGLSTSVGLGPIRVGA